MEVTHYGLVIEHKSQWLPEDREAKELLGIDRVVIFDRQPLSLEFLVFRQDCANAVIQRLREAGVTTIRRLEGERILDYHREILARKAATRFITDLPYEYWET